MSELRKLASTVERLLTADEVAEVLSISRESVLRYTKQRMLPAVHIGRTRRYRRASIEAFLERHTIEEVGRRCDRATQKDRLPHFMTHEAELARKSYFESIGVSEEEMSASHEPGANDASSK